MRAVGAPFGHPQSERKVVDEEDQAVVEVGRRAQGVRCRPNNGSGLEVEDVGRAHDAGGVHRRPRGGLAQLEGHLHEGRWRQALRANGVVDGTPTCGAAAGEGAGAGPLVVRVDKAEGTRFGWRLGAVRRTAPTGAGKSQGVAVGIRWLIVWGGRAGCWRGRDVVSGTRTRNAATRRRRLGQSMVPGRDGVLDVEPPLLCEAPDAPGRVRGHTSAAHSQPKCRSIRGAEVCGPGCPYVRGQERQEVAELPQLVSHGVGKRPPPRPVLVDEEVHQMEEA